jgi:hypothetical protein
LVNVAGSHEPDTDEEDVVLDDVVLEEVSLDEVDETQAPSEQNGEAPSHCSTCC